MSESQNSREEDGPEQPETSDAGRAEGAVRTRMLHSSVGASQTVGAALVQSLRNCEFPTAAVAIAVLQTTPLASWHNHRSGQRI